MPIGAVLDIPGHGRFLVVGHDQNAKEQLKYVGSPTKPKAVKGWTPSLPVKPCNNATPGRRGRVGAAKRPRTASRGRTHSRTRTRTYPRACPAQHKKQDGAAVWIGLLAVILFFAVLGSCNEIQSRKLPDFVTGQHGR
jgi:hypothetical protein